MQQLHQQRELGRRRTGSGGRRCRQQARVAAHLAQLEQRVQHLDLRSREAAARQRIAHRALAAQADGLVEVGLRALQRDRHGALDALGQFAGDHRLRAPQDEGRDAAPQLREAAAVALLLDGRAKAGAKALRAAEKAGHQEVEQAPQLAQVVLHRRARQREPLARIERGDHLRGLGARVLDVLRLVEHDDVPASAEPACAVALQQRVGRDDEVAVLGEGAALARGAVPHARAQGGREAGGLAPPVAQQAHGCDDEAGRVEAAVLLLAQQVCQGLQRLAQAHVVGQHAAQAVGAQVLQPGQPVLLVGPQRGLQAGRRRDLGQRLCAGQCAQSRQHRHRRRRGRSR